MTIPVRNKVMKFLVDNRICTRCSSNKAYKGLRRCRKCHGAQLTYNSAPIERAKRLVNSRKYYQENKEVLRAKSAAYRKMHKVIMTVEERRKYERDKKRKHRAKGKGGRPLGRPKNPPLPLDEIRARRREYQRTYRAKHVRPKKKWRRKTDDIRKYRKFHKKKVRHKRVQGIKNVTKAVDMEATL